MLSHEIHKGAQCTKIVPTDNKHIEVQFPNQEENPHKSGNKRKIYSFDQVYTHEHH